MKMVPLFFAVTCLFVTGCAGSTQFDSCEPKVCGVDCDIAPGKTCSDNELTMSPGGTATVKAKFKAEGSHEGSHNFTVTAAPPLTATVSPAAADVADGALLELTVTMNVDSTAMPGRYSVALEGTNVGETDLAAGTSIFVRLPEL
jgi:hypothetical protein